MSSEGERASSAMPHDSAVARGSGGSSLVSVLWGLTGILLGVVIGAAGIANPFFKQLVGTGRPAHEISELSGRLDELRRDITARERELGTERQERKEAIHALKQSLEASEWNALAATLKGDFLTRLLSHEQAKTDESRRQLIEAVCGLVGQSKAARMTIVSAPLQLSSDELRGKLRPELEQLIAQSGVDAELLARARRSPAQIPMPAITPFNVSEVQRAAQLRRLAMRDVNEAVAALQRHVQNIKLAKAVRFSDGTEYELPRDVALGMYARRDCRFG